MNGVNSRWTSFLSALIALLVPLANQTFGWHLDPSTVWAVVVALLGLGAFEVGHAHVKALKFPWQDALQVLKTIPVLLQQIAETHRPVDPGIKAGGDLARGVTVKDQPTATVHTGQ